MQRRAISSASVSHLGETELGVAPSESQWSAEMGALESGPPLKGPERDEPLADRLKYALKPPEPSRVSAMVKAKPLI
jgi:hypothetical protein